MPETVHTVLSKFGITDTVGPNRQALQISNLENAGGFSGANIWRIDSADRKFCLRRWPAGVDADRVAWIHGILFTATDRGFDKLSVPKICTATGSPDIGKSFVQFRNHIFELSPWLPGVADFEKSLGGERDAKLVSAMKTLAAFHNATAFHDSLDEMNGKSSPGLQMRAARCRRLLQGGIDELRNATKRYCSNASEAENFASVESFEVFVEEFERLARAVLPLIEEAARQPATLQPCLRDVWHDHVLFTGTDVSGIVDYDAMQFESPAADVARLLGSLVGNCRESWQHGLDVYHSQRNLTAADRERVEAFDWGNTLLSGLQWATWICVEGKRFSDVPAVLRRLHFCSGRIQGRAASDRLCL